MSSPAKKKAVCLVLPSLAFGGAEKVLVELANSLASRGFRVSLVVLTKDESLKERVNESVDLILLKKRRVLRSIPALLSALRVLRPQTIISTLGHLNIVMGYLRRIGLLSCDTLLLREASIPSIRQRGDQKARLIARMYPSAYKGADGVIAQCQLMKEDLQNNFSIPGSRISVINNFVDIEAIQSRAAEDIPFGSSKKTLLFVGSLSVVKQVAHILHALTFPKLTDAILHLVGDGAEREALETLATTLKIRERVVFHGVQANPFMYMKQADVVVLTSAYEGFPNVLIEAIALGTPVCSYNSPGGVREIIHADNGVLVEPCTPEALANAVDIILKNGLQEAAITKTASRFREEVIVSQYVELFGE